MKEQNIRQKSELFYHSTDENFYCAQAVLKGFQKEMKINNQEIEEYLTWP